MVVDDYLKNTLYYSKVLIDIKEPSKIVTVCKKLLALTSSLIEINKFKQLVQQAETRIFILDERLLLKLWRLL